MRKKTTEIPVVASSGNVFEDLKLPDAGEALIKTEIARTIGNIIARRGLTQTQAAKLLKVDQPKISALLNGQLRGFSTARLFSFANALGQDVEIALRPKPRRHSFGVTRVLKKALAGSE